MRLRIIEGIPKTDRVDERRVSLCAAGTRHDAITRLMSPGDVGQVVKPFVFLDDFAIPAGTSSVFSMYPHTGIARLTYILTGSVWINDTVGTTAVVNAGDIEWMRASGGALHESAMRGDSPLTGLKLWLAMPPNLESAAPETCHIAAQAVPRVGPASVLLGKYQGARGPISHDEGINYLSVELEAQSSWEYVPPVGHSVSWDYVYRGRLKTAGDLIERKLAVFKSGEAPILFTADEYAGFVLGSAVAHDHEFMMGPYSVHTSQAAISNEFQEINRIGSTLKLRQAGASPQV
ncbi:pirin family protein [Chitinolyticbacter albus]|uniref:pirin family protein n=1 Tax=Chitinolyticbacter albus TaxID=2961951 RepID=UPI00210C568D|nr:pirin family protein [Chitinolyticbacter albus]